MTESHVTDLYKLNYCFGCCNIINQYRKLKFDKNAIFIDSEEYNNYNDLFIFNYPIDSLTEILSSNTSYYHNLEYNYLENKECKFISLKTCLTNIHENYNKYKIIEKEYLLKINIIDNNNFNNYQTKICNDCVTLLNVTGFITLIASDISFIRDCNYFCCYKCKTPTYTNDFYFIKEINDKIVLTDMRKEVEYKEDNFREKCQKKMLNFKSNCSFCSKCFDDYCEGKEIIYNQIYYYDLLFDCKEITCYNCNDKEEYKKRFTIKKDNSREKLTLFYYAPVSDEIAKVMINIDRLKYFNNYHVNLLHNKIPTFFDKYKNHLFFASDTFRCFYNSNGLYYSSLEYSQKIKINYLHKNLPFLINKLPKDICLVILDYLVLYYHHCNKCFINNLNKSIFCLSLV